MTVNSKPPIYRDPFVSGDPRANRKGRSVGSRAKLAKRFFETLYAAWEEQGESVIARAAFHDPMGFASMVARLMPQKIEVSTPTDGMTDERLAEMLDYYERIAALRAQGIEPLQVIEGTAVVQPIALTHEKPDMLGASTEGGGGPVRAEVLRGINTSSALRADPTETTPPEHNGLYTESHNGLKQNNIPAIQTPPYPVHSRSAISPHEQERRNIAKLGDDDIDPESLF